MNSLIKRFTEAIIGQRGSVAFPEGNKQEQVYPKPDFQSMTQLLLGDPDVAASIEFISGVSVGNGFETIMNSTYKELSDGETAKQVVTRNVKTLGLTNLCKKLRKTL